MCSRFADVDFTQMLQILIISAIEKKCKEKCHNSIGQEQCDQIVLFLNVLGDKFSCKDSLNV